jgi:myosin-5
MIAGKAYQGLICGEGKQAIVISGESGAGKTESTKYCMQMLTSLSHKESHSIEKKILACNPLLEAFGNSKTVRNDNSSRFGKYVQIFFGGDNTIKGANIISYLLEKSRVVSVAPNERTYHAFYALAASGSYGVKKPQHYKYLNQSECYTASNIDDAKYFKEINSSMTEIGFNKDEIDKIWSLVAAILELGNLEFDDKRHHTNESNPCDLINKSDLPKIAKIIGITA